SPGSARCCRCGFQSRETEPRWHRAGVRKPPNNNPARARSQNCSPTRNLCLTYYTQHAPSAFGGWFACALADRFGRVRTLQITILWFAFFTLLCGFAQNYTQLLVFRALTVGW